MLHSMYASVYYASWPRIFAKSQRPSPGLSGTAESPSLVIEDFQSPSCTVAHRFCFAGSSLLARCTGCISAGMSAAIMHKLTDVKGALNQELSHRNVFALV